MRILRGVAFLSLVVSSAATSISAQEIVLCAERFGPNTTSPIVFDEPFDRWVISAINTTGNDLTSLDLSFEGEFINSVTTTFKAGADNPTVFGFEAPESFFVLPDGVDPLDVLAVDTVDSSSELSSAFTVSGGPTLLPGDGTLTPIAVLNTPPGLDFPITNEVVGQISGQGGLIDIVFLTEEHQGCIPEPGAAALCLLAISLVGPLRKRTG